MSQLNDRKDAEDLFNVPLQFDTALTALLNLALMEGLTAGQAAQILAGKITILTMVQHEWDNIAATPPCLPPACPRCPPTNLPLSAGG